MNTLPSSAYSVSPALGAEAATVVTQPVLARAGLVPGVHEQKAAGAVGVLRLARMEAALAEERRLLVARHAADGDALHEPRVRRHAEAAGRGAHLGQHGLRECRSSVKQAGIPAPLVDVVEHGAAGVGHVRGVHAPRR